MNECSDKKKLTSIEEDMTQVRLCAESAIAWIKDTVSLLDQGKAITEGQSASLRDEYSKFCYYVNRLIPARRAIREQQMTAVQECPIQEKINNLVQQFIEEQGIPSTLLADGEVNVSATVNTSETMTYLCIWRGKDLEKIELIEIRDAVVSGDYGELLGTSTDYELEEDDNE